MTQNEQGDISEDKLRQMEMASVPVPPPAQPEPALSSRPTPKYGWGSFFAAFGKMGLLFCLGALSYFLVSHFAFETVQVVGVSMYPTLRDGDHYVLNRLIYRYKEPEFGEVVVVRDPGQVDFAVKRIIGTPGASLFFKGGDVYLNGVKLEEPYLSRGTKTFTFADLEGKMIVFGTNQFYVLGDNRANSVDSRYYGPITRENILGRISP